MYFCHQASNAVFIRACRYKGFGPPPSNILVLALLHSPITNTALDDENESDLGLQYSVTTAYSLEVWSHHTMTLSLTLLPSWPP